MGLCRPFLCIVTSFQWISVMRRVWMFQVFLVDSDRLTRTKWKALIFVDSSSMFVTLMVGSGNVPVYLWLHHFPDLCDKFQNNYWMCYAPQGDSFLPDMHSPTTAREDNVCCLLKLLSSTATIVKTVPVYPLSCKKPRTWASSLDSYS